jgi:hypothetical protein
LRFGPPLLLTRPFLSFLYSAGKSHPYPENSTMNNFLISSQNTLKASRPFSEFFGKLFSPTKNDPERQSEIDPPLLPQKAVDQINLTQPPIVS